MNDSDRRYDIDWLRVIAIAMLLIYHVALVFQPWGKLIGFIQSEQSSEIIWIPMALINVWRIPLLFFVSGMGMCFALRRRDWKQLLLERSRRILLPLVFGSLLIVPIHDMLFQKFYAKEISYIPNIGHLWFLLNILIYVLQMIGLAFLDKNYDYWFFKALRKLLKRPYFLYLFMIPFILEAELINPKYFSSYVGNSHGFLIGMLAFASGYIFIATGDAFWNAVTRIKTVSLIIAFALYLVRLFYFDLNGPNYLNSIESMNWIFAIFGFGYKYLNKQSAVLSYLSQAVYPVYILHMAFLFGAAYFILPLNLSLELNLALITLITFIGSFASYELIIKRISFLRPLFGLKAER
ncbi:MAG: acyltransferase [Calditrichaeota bacterium]|nr:MAG: acyltransferase [Calditrichota bacterium]MBL1203929.1 acyltransferase [Calditrichota bacterium]NOG43762.1 acyltransferase family protein [Calditrichota bacterium]